MNEWYFQHRKAVLSIITAFLTYIILFNWL